MAEDTQQQQDNSKTLVSFVVGLLIGGMLVWAFSGPGDHKDRDHGHDHGDEMAEEMSDDEGETAGEDMVDESVSTIEEPSAPTLPVGDGSITVNDQPAGSVVNLERATYPIEEGWVGVRDYNNGQLSFIKGVVRFSAEAGLVPESIPLVPTTPTQAGREYAVVVFSEDGDGTFNPAGDQQIPEIFATFTAQ